MQNNKNNNFKNILVTGASGFIATNLIKYILSKNKECRIYCLDNYSSGKKSNNIKSKKIIYFTGNTTKINKNKKLLNKKIDVVYHFAEFSRIVPSFKFYDECFQSNSLGTYEVIKFCLNKKAKLIYSASSSTLGKNKFLSPYSWTKYCNNELIKNFSKWFGLNYIIVYFYNVYGHNQIRTGKMSSVIGIFENQFIKNRKLTVVKPGTQKRDFTHVDDIVEGTYLASIKANNDEFHIGSGKNFTILQVAKMFKNDFKMVEERPGERFYSLSTSNKAKKKLGYMPKKDLKNYIREFIKNKI